MSAMPRDPMHDELKARVQRALISYALFRWESAVIIGMTVLLAVLYPEPFPPWRWYYWVVLGMVAEALIIYTSLTDEATARRVLETLFREQHNPRLISKLSYRRQFERALEYQSRIDKAVGDMKKGILRDRLERADRGVQSWVSQIYHLARRLDRYEGNEVIARDLKAVPQELHHLNLRLNEESDHQVRQELHRAIERKQAQWHNLQQLQNAMESAQVRLDSTLTALATVYSQILLAAAKGDEGASAERLSSDIADQIASLQDVIETMDEVLKY